MYETLADIQNGHAVRTQAVADFAHYSYSYTAELLRRLERRGYVARPRGERSGWVITHEH